MHVLLLLSGTEQYVDVSLCVSNPRNAFGAVARFSAAPRPSSWLLSEPGSDSGDDESDADEE